MDRGAWRATAHGVTKSRTRLAAKQQQNTGFTSVMVLYGRFPSGSVVENPTNDAEDVGLIPGLGRSPGEGNGKPLLYSCLEIPMDRGAWRATVHGVTKSQTRLST